MMGGSAGVNHGCACGIATMHSLIELVDYYHLTIESPYSERGGEAPTEPRTAVLVPRRRMGVADRANRDGVRPAACLGSRASCPLRARQPHAVGKPA